MCAPFTKERRIGHKLVFLFGCIYLANFDRWFNLPFFSGCPIAHNSVIGKAKNQEKVRELCYFEMA